MTSAPVRARGVLTAHAENSRAYLDGGFVANAADLFGVRAGAQSATLIVVGYPHCSGGLDKLDQRIGSFATNATVAWHPVATFDGLHRRQRSRRVPG